MKKLIVTFWATFLILAPDGNPMTITGLSREQIEKQGIYRIVDQATYDAAVAAIPPPPVVDRGPSLDDRVAALETAVQAVATKTGTVITLETSGVTP